MGFKVSYLLAASLLLILSLLSPVLSIDELSANAHNIKFVRKSDPSSVVIPFTYPLYSQCNSTWGSEMMVDKTICQVGCLMSSTSMGLSGAGISIGSTPSNPSSLNTWLRSNEGYVGHNNLVESQVPLINPQRISWPADGMHSTNDLSFDEVTQQISKGRLVVANVNNGGHFVLLVGWNLVDKDTFIVNDPGYDRSEYSYSHDVVGYRIYDVVRQR